MQLGFVSAILPELSLKEVLAAAAEIGYDCVEVMCWPVSKAERRYAGVTHIDVTEFGQSQADEIAGLTSEYGVSISGMGYYPNLLAADRDAAETHASHLRKVIEAAAVLGIAQVTSFVGRDPVKSVDDNWPRFLEVWRPMLEFAEQHNVRIGIENCPMLFTQDEWPGGQNLATSPAIWRRMFNDIPSKNFGLNYDPSHFVWQRMDYCKPLEEFVDRIFHAHAKDVRVDRRRLDEVGMLATPLEYHTPKLPGLGEVDWGRFVSELGQAGYRGPVCVEVEDRVYEDSLASRRRALQQSYTFLRNFIPKLSAE